jgi:hypothetical protein
MGTTVKDDQFIRIFKSSVKIDARTISIKTLLSERNLRRIDYNPYYQRHYVWDNIKQTFFIESVILGTEIPPIIFFKSGMRMEVIDGRQRFETLKRFKENDLILSSKGLLALSALERKSFNKLKTEIQDVFWNSNIRIFEFEVINEPNLDPEIEDKIKKEIFRRYNTGITPLTSNEVDNAKYDDDLLSAMFRKEIKKNSTFEKRYKKCFYSNTEESKVPIDNIINDIRKYYVINSFPIYRYAAGSNRSEILDLLYDFATQRIENIDTEFSTYKKEIETVFTIFDFLSKDPELHNKLIYECILWAIRILDMEDIRYDIFEFRDEIKLHFQNNISLYSEENSHYYKSIITRFTDTACLFNKLTGLNFNLYVKNVTFSDRIKSIKQTEKQAVDVLEQLSSLRINKPSPISTPIDEIKTDIKTNRYLVRPSYQRQEKVTQLKASSIIESILLGINLPPIFVYKKNDRTKEVVDGQQRLLSVIGFLGERYMDENGVQTITKINNFKLKGLKILDELNSKNYSALSEVQKDKILDFTIDVIIIEESLNPDFDPTDLFIRLNNKPYPIQPNSFEMWNSTVDKAIIQMIKKVANQHSTWFFSKETNEDPEKRTDRMENEELITILSYISYHKQLSSTDKILGLFNRKDRITCRLKNKTGLSDFLLRLEKEVTEKNRFINCIEKTNQLIILFGELFEDNPSKEKLNHFLNVKATKTFKRSFQDFYVIWLIMNDMKIEYITLNKSQTLAKIKSMISTLKNIDEIVVDDEYLENFKQELHFY